MKIIQFTAENIKKLRAVSIRPDGSLVQITGANGQGKSSVLDAIYMALAGGKAIPGKPVREGEDKALIRLDLGEIVVTRRFTAAGGTSLTVEAQNGARFPTPQRMLDELLGALTFDPLAFSRMEPRRQLETLRGLVQLEVDVDALDRANAQDYAERTDANRAAREARARADGIEVPDDLPDEPVDVNGMLEELAGAADQAAEIEARRARRRDAEREADTFTRDAEDMVIRADQLRAQAAELLDRAEALEANAELHRGKAESLRRKLAAAEPLPEPPDTEALRQRIAEGQRINRAIEARIRREDELETAAAWERRAQELTDAMAERTRQREEAIRNAAMPVPGLGFSAEGVTFNGLPFDQASSAEQLRVSVAIAMAANPKLRVLRIKDGSLLDEHSLRMIGEMAEAADYQVWVEMVDTSGSVGIVMEDGAVAGSGAAPAEELFP